MPIDGQGGHQPLAIPTPPAFGPPPPPGRRPKAMPIMDPKEYPKWIRRWMTVVSNFDFPDIEHKSPTQQAQGIENRRRVLLAVGEICLGRGSIRTALPVREVAKRAGVGIRTAHAHLTTEAECKRLLYIFSGGVSGVGSGKATVYKLNLNLLEDLGNEQAQRAALAG